MFASRPRQEITRIGETRMNQGANCLLAASLLLAAGAANAVLVEVDWINANVLVNGSSDGSGTRPVAIANATSTVGFDTHTGTAIQNENGFSSLELTVSCDGNEGFACNGSPDEEINNRATAIRSITFTNDQAYAQTGTFSFSLSGMELELFFVGGEASVEFAVGATNGSTYNAEMTIWSYFSGAPIYDILTSTMFTGTIVTSECFEGFCNRGSMTVDPLSGSISLGTLDPGQSVTVQTTFDIYTSYRPFEIGAQAKAVDPGTFSWDFSPASASPVPLPASAWLVGTGLIGASIVRRRKQRA
jgi:hypothetical protein